MEMWAWLTVLVVNRETGEILESSTKAVSIRSLNEDTMKRELLIDAARKYPDVPAADIGIRYLYFKG